MTVAEFELNALGQPVGQRIDRWQPAELPPCKALTGIYCRLEPLDIDTHARALYDANAADQSGAMWTYLPYGPFESFTAYQDWMRAACSSSDPLFYTIFDLTTGRAVGLASYLRIDPKIGSIEVGHLAYSPALQRRPAATEAMYLLMAQAFALGNRRYEWKCNALNQPSRIAAQRLGFSYEGVFRQASIVKGRNRDTAWYALTDQDWPALQEAFVTWLAPSNFDDHGNQRQRLSALTSSLLINRG